MGREGRGSLTGEEIVEETVQVGCPMLVLAHRDDPVNGGRMWRCELAWALRGDEDARRCGAVSSAADCWKVHPERADAPPPVRDRRPRA